VQQVILGLLLLHGPLSLYAAQRLFAQGISLFYSASFGSIQRALKQLVERGLATVEGASADTRGRKPYTITDAGIRAWREWMAEPLTGGDLETAALSRIFFLGLIDDVEERGRIVAAIRERIDADLGELRGVAAALDQADVPAAFSDVFAYQRATLDYGIRSHEHARDWFAALADRVQPGRAVRG
jgi:DNA-binding PadR family transcriptional regulator